MYEFCRVGEPLCSAGAFEGASDLNGAVFDHWGVAEGMDDSVEAGAMVAFARRVVITNFEGEAEDLFARGLLEEMWRGGWGKEPLHENPVEAEETVVDEGGPGITVEPALAKTRVEKEVIRRFENREPIINKYPIIEYIREEKHTSRG